MAVIRELFARLGVEADTDKVDRFDAAIDRAKDGLKSAALAATALGAAAATAVGMMVSETSQAALEIQSVADRFELSTDKVQELGSIARGAGMELEDFADIINTMNERALDGVLDPKSDPGQTLRRLGIDATDASGKLKSSEALLGEMADAFAKIENPAQRSAEASILLGDVGVKLLPILKDGRAGLEAMGAAAQSTGVVMSEAALKDLAEFRKQQHQLAESTRGLRQRIALLAIKALRPLGDLLIKRVIPAVQRLIGRLEAWFKDTERVNKILSRLKMVARLAAAAVAVIVGAKVIAMTGSFAAAILHLVKGFIMLRKVAGLAAAKVLIIPAAIALLALLVEDLFTFLNGGDSLIGRFVSKFAETEGPLGDIARAILNAKPLLQDLFAAAMRIGRQMMAALARILPVVMGIIAELLPLVMQTGSELLGLVSEVVMMIIPLIQDLVPVVKQIIGAVMGIVRALWPAVMAIIKAILQAIRALIPAVQVVLQVIVDAIQMIIPILQPVIEFLSNALVWIAGFVAQLVAGIATLISGLAEFLRPLAEGLVAWWSDTASPAVSGFIENVKGFFQGAVDFIMGILGPIIDTVDGVMKKVNQVTNLELPSIGDVFGGERTAGGVAAAARQAAAAQQTNNNSNIGSVQVQVQGSTNMGPGEVAQATATGVRNGVEEAQRAAARDVSAG